jgi:hypothetical protein
MTCGACAQGSRAFPRLFIWKGSPPRPRSPSQPLGQANSGRHHRSSILRRSNAASHAPQQAGHGTRPLARRGRACCIGQSRPGASVGHFALCEAYECHMHPWARSATTSGLGEAGMLAVLSATTSGPRVRPPLLASAAGPPVLAPAAGLSEVACKLCARARARAIPPRARSINACPS